MPGLEVGIHTGRMLHSTPLHQAARAPEHLYYALLFAGAPRYRGDAGVWRSWLQMGFSLGLKEGPPGAALEDRVRSSVNPQPREITVRLHGGDHGTVERLRSVLEAVNGLRPSGDGKRQSLMAADALTSPSISRHLVGPVREALQRAGLRPDEQEAFERLVLQAIEALTQPDVTSLQMA